MARPFFGINHYMKLLQEIAELRRENKRLHKVIDKLEIQILDLERWLGVVDDDEEEEYAWE